jgi:hypothetical protein
VLVVGCACRGCVWVCASVRSRSAILSTLILASRYVRCQYCHHKYNPSNSVDRPHPLLLIIPLEKPNHTTTHSNKSTNKHTMRKHRGIVGCKHMRTAFTHTHTNEPGNRLKNVETGRRERMESVRRSGENPRNKIQERVACRSDCRERTCACWSSPSHVPIVHRTS